MENQRDLVRIKISAKLGDKTLLEHVLFKINNKFQEILIVSSHSLEIQKKKNLTIIPDCHDDLGPLAGVLSSMKWVKKNQKVISVACNISIRHTFF